MPEDIQFYIERPDRYGNVGFSVKNSIPNFPAKRIGDKLFPIPNEITEKWSRFRVDRFIESPLQEYRLLTDEEAIDIWRQLGIWT